MFLRLATRSGGSLLRVKQTPVVGILLESCRNLFRLRWRAATRLRVCGLLFCALLICLSPTLSGCRKAGEPLPDIVVEHEITPHPPKAGPATVILKLSGSNGTPQNDAQVSLEGNMSHPGMRPVFSEARATEPGRYEAPIEFTMGGDWIILVHITLQDGRRLERQFEIKAVDSQ